MWTMPLFAFDYVSVSVTVSSVRHKKHCVDGNHQHSFVADTRVVLFSRSTVATILQPKLICAIVNDFGHYPVPYVVQF